MRAVGVLLLLGVIGIALPGCGGPTSLAGTYETVIPGHKEFFSGRWQVQLNKNGTITPIVGQREISLAVSAGSYWRGDTFVINAPDRECGPPYGTGTYKMKLTGSTLRFKVVSDACKARVVILSPPYKRVR
jgi:hypothetical protein